MLANGESIERKNGQAKKGRKVNALALGADERRGKLRKASGRTANIH